MKKCPVDLATLFFDQSDFVPRVEVRIHIQWSEELVGNGEAEKARP